MMKDLKLLLVLGIILFAWLSMYDLFKNGSLYFWDNLFQTIYIIIFVKVVSWVVREIKKKG
ncbi:hypothetical protein [Terribacillus saccharophilus]|uniref:hypothetical protein n=1 Tax=Terribacillus saccharophilus TaxID=361277 RepID=UPI003D2E6528